MIYLPFAKNYFNRINTSIGRYNPLNLGLVSIIRHGQRVVLSIVGHKKTDITPTLSNMIISVYFLT